MACVQLEVVVIDVLLAIVACQRKQDVTVKDQSFPSERDYHTEAERPQRRCLPGIPREAS